MTFEIRVNGALRIHMTAESPIEKLAVQEMAEAVSKGQRVSLTQSEEKTLILSLES